VQILKEDTIAAIATALGEGGIGVIRISGPASLSVLKKVFTPAFPVKKWRSHRMIFGEIAGEDGKMLDEVLAVWMAEGRSYTGEEVVEIHGHGGRLNLLQLLRRILAEEVRVAEPGEFTRRAFLNGRIDLTQAEAIAEMINAKNERALEMARNHLQGHLQKHLHSLAERSLMLAAQVESWIDFPEEFDPALDESVGRIMKDLEDFQQALRELLDSYQVGQQLQQGWSILLLGRPNAGKSSLFNKLNGEEKAIVTSLPGTTRDLLEAQIALGGIQLTLTDTAGLRKRSSEVKDQEVEAHEAIEQIGVGRALNAAEQANLLLAVVDLSRAWSEEDQQVLEACQGRPTVLICNKADLPREMPEEKLEAFQAVWRIETSCKEDLGIGDLRKRLHNYIEQETPAHELVISNERQRDALAQALHFAEKSMREGYELGPEFMAEDLRLTRNALSEITGQVSSEEILGTIFSSFCIGK